jgi:hypothetical protein
MFDLIVIIIVIVIVLLRLLPSSCLPNEGMQRKQERK